MARPLQSRVIVPPSVLLPARVAGRPRLARGRADHRGRQQGNDKSRDGDKQRGDHCHLLSCGAAGRRALLALAAPRVGAAVLPAVAIRVGARHQRRAADRDPEQCGQGNEPRLHGVLLMVRASADCVDSNSGNPGRHRPDRPDLRTMPIPPTVGCDLGHMETFFVAGNAAGRSMGRADAVSMTRKEVRPTCASDARFRGCGVGGCGRRACVVHNPLSGSKLPSPLSPPSPSSADGPR